jgi:hypothetical protein
MALFMNRGKLTNIDHRIRYVCPNEPKKSKAVPASLRGTTSDGMGSDGHTARGRGVVHSEAHPCKCLSLFDEERESNKGEHEGEDDWVGDTSSFLDTGRI